MERSSPGEFCWVELATSDRRAGLAFYAGLFGWNGFEQEVELPGRTFAYAVVGSGGRHLGSAYELLAEQRESGIAPHWLPYVAVESVEEVNARAEDLGAACLVDPVAVYGVGRMSILEDPTGSAFALWQAGSLAGFQVGDAPGSPCWFELATPDMGRALEFYGALFGWGSQPPSNEVRDAVVLTKGARPIAGVTALAAGSAPRWTTGFAVADCDASCARIRGSGGTVVREPARAAGVARAATVADPQGALFAIVEPRSRS